MTACGTCAVELPDGARFCFSCGATQGAPTCSSCSAPLVAGARFCMECGASQGAGPAPPPSTAQPVSARRVTSVLFGDLVGFTTLAEHRDQEETRELLTRYFDECRRIIERYGGTVEKFIGDAVMAVWGVPTAHEDDAERSVRAALELVNAVTSMGADVGVPDLAMRAGIVTGEVAVTIGAEQQGMVAGDAVNTAARVQSVAAPGQVWVDETTRLLTTSAITFTDVGSHALKGKAEPVPLWSVRAVVAGVGGAQRADGLEAPLVGRERELRLVKELFHAVEDSARPALMVLVGEAGVGKSRLSWEFEKYIDGLSGSVRWHSGRCVAYGEGVAFFALAEAIRGRLRALHPGIDDAFAEDPSRLLEDALERYVPDEQERTWLRPRLGVLLGTGSVGTYPREDLFASWTAFLQRVGEDEHPVVLVIDDAQHADDGLLQFVEHLLGAARFRCFVLLLTRPGLLERHPSLATSRSSTVSHLEVLSDADVGRLLDGLVPGVPEAVRASLVARSEGVPLFAVETVRSLVDRDLVVPRGGQYVLADPDHLDLDAIGAPASLHALIAARLDALDPDQRHLVDRACVVGNVFSREQIADLSRGSGQSGEVDGVLASLVRLQILSQASSRFSADYGQYQFVQTVVRQVAYASLSRRDRKATHLAVAALTERIDDASGDLAPIIAQHYLDAVEALPAEPDVPDLEARAIEHLERAAGRARALGALSESAVHLEAALERAHGAELRARLEAAVAWALVDAGDYRRPIPFAESATRAFDELDDPISAGLAAAAHGYALSLAGDNAQALAVVEPRWDALLEAAGAERTQLALGRAVVSAHGRLGRLRRDVMERRIQIAERIGDQEELADSLTALSVDYSWLGAGHTARVLMEAAADLARTHHLPVSLARCLSNLTVEYGLRDLERAVEVATEAVEVADRGGVAIWRDFTRGNRILVLLASGRWAEAERALDEAVTVAAVTPTFVAAVGGQLSVLRGHGVGPGLHEQPDSDDPSDQAWWAFAQGMDALARGSRGSALEHLVGAAELMSDLSGMTDDLVHMWPPAVELAIGLGDHERVTVLLGLVDDNAPRVQVPLGILAHRRRFAGLLARVDDPDVAEPLLREGIELFTEWGALAYRARTQVELGQWLLARGDADDGRTLVEAGREELADLDAATWLAEVGEPVSGPVHAG